KTMYSYLPKTMYCYLPITPYAECQNTYDKCYLNILVVYTYYIYLWNNAYVMKTISLKIDDSIFVETENILSKIKKPRNRYINEALEYYNKIQRRKILESKLKKESALVKDESLSVLNEFEEIDYAS
ncbi:MAG TPA: hypothetical protein PLI41_07625, partial [Bacteroidales bacterium]|nr:hypothetical protein [Bacteroidales bacterium]